MDGGRVGYQNAGIVTGEFIKKVNLPTDISNLNKFKFSAASPLIYKAGAANETIKEKVEKEVRKTK